MLESHGGLSGFGSKYPFAEGDYNTNYCELIHDTLSVKLTRMISVSSKYSKLPKSMAA
jgi:hypothetical protein